VSLALAWAQPGWWDGGLQGSALPRCRAGLCLRSGSWRGFWVFFPPSFLFPLLYITAKIFGLSQLWGKGGVSSAAWRSWGPALHPPGAAGHGEGGQGSGDAETARARCTGERWPGLAWEVSAEAAGTASLPPRGLPGPDPAPQGAAVVGVRTRAGQGLSAPFPIDFHPAWTTLHPSWSPLLGSAPGRVLGPWGPAAPSEGWHQPQTRQKVWLKKGFYRPFPGTSSAPCVLSPPEMTPLVPDLQVPLFPLGSRVVVLKGAWFRSQRSWFRCGLVSLGLLVGPLGVQGPLEPLGRPLDPLLPVLWPRWLQDVFGGWSSGTLPGLLWPCPGKGTRHLPRGQLPPPPRGRGRAISALRSPTHFHPAWPLILSHLTPALPLLVFPRAREPSCGRLRRSQGWGVSKRGSVLEPSQGPCPAPLAQGVHCLSIPLAGLPSFWDASFFGGCGAGGALLWGVPVDPGCGGLSPERWLLGSSPVTLGAWGGQHGWCLLGGRGGEEVPPGDAGALSSAVGRVRRCPSVLPSHGTVRLLGGLRRGGAGQDLLERDCAYGSLGGGQRESPWPPTPPW